MNAYDIRRTVGLTGALLVVAALVLFVVPAVNIWPFVLLFGALGGGLLIGALLSWSDEHHGQRVQNP